MPQGDANIVFEMPAVKAKLITAFSWVEKAVRIPAKTEVNRNCNDFQNRCDDDWATKAQEEYVWTG